MRNSAVGQQDDARSRMRLKRFRFNRRFPEHAVALTPAELIAVACHKMVRNSEYRAAGVEVRAYTKRGLR